MQSARFAAASRTEECKVAHMAMMKRLQNIVEELEEMFPDSEVSLDLGLGKYNELTITIKHSESSDATSDDELENVK